MDKGYMGKVLVVDLGTGAVRTETIPDNVYENYLSGLGLGAYLLFQWIPPEADPLGPDNVLGFMSGLLTGTGSLFTGRWMVVGKSPLTGCWGDANCGGTFSPAIKRSQAPMIASAILASMTPRLRLVSAAAFLT